MTTEIDKLKSVLPDTLTPKEQLDIIKKRQPNSTYVECYGARLMCRKVDSSYFAEGMKKMPIAGVDDQYYICGIHRTFHVADNGEVSVIDWFTIQYYSDNAVKLEYFTNTEEKSFGEAMSVMLQMVRVMNEEKIKEGTGTK